MSLDGTLEAVIDDDAVHFAFTISNSGTDPVELRFPSAKVADVVVSEDERVVWRSADGRMFTQAIRSEIVEPGEPLVQEATWKSPSRGVFTAEAALAATEVTLTDEVTVVIE